MESDVLASNTLPSPVKSPLKTTPVVNSPSKEDEFARRKALEKKLEDDKQKPKRKKKKLMWDVYIYHLRYNFTGSLLYPSTWLRNGYGKWSHIDHYLLDYFCLSHCA